MRFITEFVLSENEAAYSSDLVSESRRKNGQRTLGDIITAVIGWESPVHGNAHRHRLEIEAFPMDKWIEFKKRLFNALPDYDVTSRIKIINAMAYLESHEKPVTNDQSKTGSQL